MNKEGRTNKEGRVDNERGRKRWWEECTFEIGVYEGKWIEILYVVNLPPPPPIIIIL
jgi:hypothetical protein